MKNSDFNVDALGGFISNEASLLALKGIIDDFDLELDSVDSLS